MSATEALATEEDFSPLEIRPGLPGEVLDAVRQQNFSELRDQTLAHMREHAPVLERLPLQNFELNIRSSEQEGYGVLIGGFFAYKLVCEIVGDRTDLLKVTQEEVEKVSKDALAYRVPVSEQRVLIRQMFLELFGQKYPELVDTIVNKIRSEEATVSAMSVFLIYSKLFVELSSALEEDSEVITL